MTCRSGGLYGVCPCQPSIMYEMCQYVVWQGKVCLVWVQAEYEICLVWVLSYVFYAQYCVGPSIWSGLVCFVSWYEKYPSSGSGQYDVCLVFSCGSIGCILYGMYPVWGVSVWGVSIWGVSVAECRGTDIDIYELLSVGTVKQFYCCSGKFLTNHKIIQAYRVLWNWNCRITS